MENMCLLNSNHKGQYMRYYKEVTREIWLKTVSKSQALLLMSIISAPGKLRQEDCH